MRTQLSRVRVVDVGSRPGMWACARKYRAHYSVHYSTAHDLATKITESVAWRRSPHTPAAAAAAAAHILRRLQITADLFAYHRRLRRASWNRIPVWVFHRVFTGLYIQSGCLV